MCAAAQRLDVNSTFVGSIGILENKLYLFLRFDKTQDFDKWVSNVVLLHATPFVDKSKKKSKFNFLIIEPSPLLQLVTMYYHKNVVLSLTNLIDIRSGLYIVKCLNKI